MVDWIFKLKFVKVHVFEKISTKNVLCIAFLILFQAKTSLVKEKKFYQSMNSYILSKQIKIKVIFIKLLVRSLICLTISKSN